MWLFQKLFHWLNFKGIQTMTYLNFFVYGINSVKPAMFLKWGSYNEEVVTTTYDISNKNVCYLAALQHLGNT